MLEQGILLSDFERQALVRDLQSEFRLIRKLSETKDHLAGQETYGGHFNRYTDLKPFKHTRVRLQQRGADISDSYINANYINSAVKANDQVFIATQGPLPTTRENFWRMIVQENVPLILNLTKVKENGKVRCDTYWPSEVGESISFVEAEQNIQITLISCESLMKNLIKRKLQIYNTDEDREIMEVVQINYLSWPDHGAPEPSDYQIIGRLQDIIEEFKKVQVPNTSPKSQGGGRQK